MSVLADLEVDVLDALDFPPQCEAFPDEVNRCTKEAVFDVICRACREHDLYCLDCTNYVRSIYWLGADVAICNDCGFESKTFDQGIELRPL